MGTPQTRNAEAAYWRGFEDGERNVFKALARALQDAGEKYETEAYAINEVADYLLGKGGNAGHVQNLLVDGFYDVSGHWVGEPPEEE